MKLKFDGKIALYALFALAALAAFLYLRFPGEETARFAASTLSAWNPEAVLQIDALKPAFPPGLRAQRVVVKSRDFPTVLFQAEALTVRPEYLSLLKGPTVLLIHADSYGGTLRGRFTDPPFRSPGGVLNARLDFDGLDIGRNGCLKEQLGRQISGRMKGTMNFSGPSRDWGSGTGTVEFTLLDGTYPLQEGILGFDRLDFRRVDAQLGLKNGVLTVNRLKLEGERISGTLSGEITINRKEFRGSQMNLACTFEIPGTGNRRLSMTLSGTVANPVMKFSPL